MRYLTWSAGILGLMVLSSTALGQRLPEESPIQAAMASLSSGYSTVYMRLGGTETIGARSTNLGYDTYFQYDPPVKGRELYKVSILAYLNGILVKRYCADGVTLWTYDLRTNQYSAVKYGTYAGPQPPRYASDLFTALSAAVDSYGAYSVEVLSQTYAVGGANYESWMPLFTPKYDPITTGLKYVDGLNPNVAPYRSISFVTSSGSLDNVIYRDVHSTGGLVQTIDWNMALTPGFTFDYRVFQFAPPKGARAIASPSNGIR